MLLLSMSLEELLSEFLKNKNIIEERFDKRLSDMVRLSKRTKVFPCVYKFDYSYEKQKYLVLQYFYCKNPYKNNQNKYIVLGLFDTDKGIYVVRTVRKLDRSGAEKIERYQPHFFARYKSRCNKIQEGDELIAEYFKNNDLINLKYTRKENSDGSIHYAAFGTCSEGILLGNYEPETEHTKWNTFITREMLSRIQTRYSLKLDNDLDILRTMGYSEVSVSDVSYYIQCGHKG